MSRWTADGRRFRKDRRTFLATFTICWICGHPGSDTIDHAIPASLQPDLRFDQANWRPAHGVNGCPRCGRKCNPERGNRMTMPQTRRSRRW